MQVRFWGTRGSIATPGAATVRYGGNTACVQVRTDDGTLLVLDVGTGARELGLSLAASGPVRAHVLVGHTHSDHIQGLPFFVPAFMAGSHLTVYGPAGVDRSFPSAIGGQMENAYFPVPVYELPARLEFVELGEDEFALGNVLVRTQFLNHTAPCLGYRVIAGGVTLVYATDHEQHVPSLWRSDRPDGVFDARWLLHPGDARHVAFLSGADLVVHDAQYTGAEYLKKVGWGHSSVEYVVDVAIAAGVRRLALFHHDPTRGDTQVDALVESARRYIANLGASLEVFGAVEGAQIELEERVRASADDAAPHTPLLPTNARILVAEDDPALSELLVRALERDGYELIQARDGAEAVQKTVAQRVDLVLLDVGMPVMDGLSACRAMRADRRMDDVPIIMLTGRTEEEDLLAGFREGVTDYMTKPFALSQVRARVRSWLLTGTRGSG